MSSDTRPRDRAWFTSHLERGKRERTAAIIKVTPGLAALMLERNAHNRRLAPARVTKYARILMEGRWKLTIEGIGFDRDGNLLNGQHRLHAIIEAATPAQLTVWFGCDPGEFAVIDQGASRTGSDLCTIADMTYCTARAAIAQITLRIKTRQNIVFDANRVYREVLDLVGPMMDEALAAGGRVARVCPATAASLAYYTIATKTRSAGKLLTFWESLLTGADLGRSSPILKLRDTLANREIGSRNSRQNTVRIAAAIIMAWNAYVTSKRAGTLAWNKVIELPEVM